MMLKEEGHILWYSEERRRNISRSKCNYPQNCITQHWQIFYIGDIKMYSQVNQILEIMWLQIDK